MFKMAKMIDPNTPAAGCTAASIAVCDYAIGGSALINNFTLYFWTEQKPNGLAAAGLHSADANGIVN